MPNLLAPPSALDVEVMFKSASYWPTNPAKWPLAREQAATGILSAQSEWDRMTGYSPFWSANAAAQTYDFWIDPSQFASTGVLQLGNGLLRVDEVRVGGQVIAPGAFVPKPDNAPQKGASFFWFRFPRSRFRSAGDTLHIQITGRWGYCTAYPGDAWQNILQAAGLIALTQIENLQSIASLSQDGFNKALDVVGILTQKDTADRWRHEFPAAIQRYRLPVA